MFIILALPRSRTQWLSKFLTHGDITCHHEWISTRDSLDDIVTLGSHGTAETFGAVVWRQLYARIPDAKWVIVKRPIAEVDASLRRQGYVRCVEHYAAFLRAAEAAIPALVVDYHDINDRLGEIWAHCRNDAMPKGRERMTEVVIDEPLSAQLARIDHDRIRRLRCSR